MPYFIPENKAHRLRRGFDGGFLFLKGAASRSKSFSLIPMQPMVLIGPHTRLFPAEFVVPMNVGKVP